MELDYYTVGSSYGWNQENFADPMMKTGGCAAVTACDSMIYFSKYRGLKKCCPIDVSEITVKSYKAFSRVMKPYLQPRWGGIDSLAIYIEGLSAYLKDAGEEGISISGFSGYEDSEEAKRVLKAQIDRKIPVPCLNLNHKDSEFKDFEWHWFMITGYSYREAAAENEEIRAGGGSCGFAVSGEGADPKELVELGECGNSKGCCKPGKDGNSEETDGHKRRGAFGEQSEHDKNRRVSDSMGWRFMVKLVSYGEFVWVDFDRLWNTGCKKRGGLIIFALHD